MQALSYYCGQCSSLLEITPTTGELVQSCPSCQTQTRLLCFPALAEVPKEGVLGQNIVVDNESSCFEHPDKQAVTACGGCGKFMCSLCDIDWGQGHLCSTCVGAKQAKKDPAKPALRYFHYDSMALILSLLIISPVYIASIFTAPVALFMCFFYWNKLTPSPRTRIRFILAGFFVILTLALWILGFSFIGTALLSGEFDV